MRHFTHSGDIGDIIYSLPTIRACGGGSLTIFDYPGRTAHGMNSTKFERIKTLLDKQDYLYEVIWSNSLIDSSLNGFRDHRYAGNLADMHLATHGFDYRPRCKQWLTVEAVHAYDVIINRTQRYNNHGFDWPEAIRRYGDQIGFVGSPEEHGFFCLQFGKVNYLHAPDLLTLAQYIAGSKLFIGNYSAPAAISEGLKHPMVIEVCPDHNHQLAIFQRMGCILGWDARIEWPEL